MSIYRMPAPDLLSQIDNEKSIEEMLAKSLLKGKELKQAELLAKIDARNKANKEAVEARQKANKKAEEARVKMLEARNYNLPARYSDKDQEYYTELSIVIIILVFSANMLIMIASALWNF